MEKKAFAFVLLGILLIISLFSAFADNTDFQDTTQNQTEIRGYIIQFEDKPLIEEKEKLEEKAEENKEYIEASSPLNPIAIYKRAFATMPEDIPEKIKDYSEELSKENRKIEKRALSRIKKTEITTTGKFEKSFNGLALDITAEEAEEIKNVNGVKDVYPNLEVNAFLMDSVSLIGADTAWQLDEEGNDCVVSGKECLTGKGVTIAIIDTGIDYTHPDLGACTEEQFLSGSCQKVIGGYDLVNSDNNPMDDHGHGTHCAGIAAGSGNGGLKGVAPDAKLYAYKVLNKAGSGWMSDIILAIEMAVDPNQDGDSSDHVDVISMSLGAMCWQYSDSCGPDDPVNQAVDNAVRAGVVTVNAAGNSGPGEKTIGSPATSRKTITVGATYKKDYQGTYWGETNPKTDQITTFSSRGPVEWKEGYLVKPDIVAPGAIICAARYDNLFPEGKHQYYKPCLDENHVQLAGTSMSCPHVAGIVALLKQKNPDWFPEEIKAILKNTAVDIGEDVNTQGAGRVNLLESSKIPNNFQIPIAVLDVDYELKGIVEIKGTAKAESFSKYSIQIMKEESDAWETLIESTTPVENDILMTWDTSDFFGIYNIRLVVEGANQKLEDTTKVNIKNLEISHPETKRIVFEKESVEIKGSVYHTNLKEYEILIDDKSSETIKLKNNQKNVLDGILGSWDLQEIAEPGYHALQIVLTLNDGTIKKSEKISVYIDPFLNKDFLRNVGAEVYAPPVSGDVNGDGKEEIVFKDYSEKVHVIDSSGKYLPGWPKLFGSGKCGSLCETSPTLADLDNDGKDEIIVQTVWGEAAGMGVAISDSLVFISDYKGNTKKISLGQYSLPKKTAIVTDLNNDNIKEIIASFSSYLFILDNKGDLINSCSLNEIVSKGYPSEWESINSMPVIANFDDDEDLEIAFTTKLSRRYSTLTDNSIHIINMDCSNVIQPITFLTQQKQTTFLNSLIAGDIDNDGGTEIIVVYDFIHDAYSFASYLTVVNADGTLQEGKWPQELSKGTGETIGEISLANIDGGDDIEIILGSFYGILRAYKSNGAKVEGNWPFWAEYSSKINVYGITMGSLVAGDIQGDSNIEILGGAMDRSISEKLGEFYVFNPYGESLDTWPKSISSESRNYGDKIQTPIISDFDKDGFVDLFFVGEDGTPYLWNLNKQYDASTMQWPMYRHDKQHTGWYNFHESSVQVQQECGNNIREGTEICDGEDLAGQTCQTQGFNKGTLSCLEDCSGFDTSNCIKEPCQLTNAYWSKTQAGDGEEVSLIVEGINCKDEEVKFEIKEDDFIGDDPVSQNPANSVFSNGKTLSVWKTEYLPDISGNPEYYFIATLIEDESVKTNSKNHNNGILVVSPKCGNNIREGAEICDGTDLAGQTCKTHRFDSGALSCLPDCSDFNIETCYKYECGNNIIEGNEECDGKDDSTCPGLCKSNCKCKVSTPQQCGNDIKEEPEQCDGSDLADKTCLSLFNIPGTLTCDECKFDSTNCEINICEVDIDKNGIVNIQDLTDIRVNFGEKNCNVPDWCAGRDVNKDSVVDTKDYSIVRDRLGKECKITCGVYTGCPAPATTKYCSTDLKKACTKIISYTCENPGTPQSNCVPIEEEQCTACPNICENRECTTPPPEKITCYNNADCPSQTTTKYCKTNQACTLTTTYTCKNSGTPQSQCISSQNEKCSACPNSCVNGDCTTPVSGKPDLIIDEIKLEYNEKGGPCPSYMYYIYVKNIGDAPALKTAFQYQLNVNLEPPQPQRTNSCTSFTTTSGLASVSYSSENLNPGERDAYYDYFNPSQQGAVTISAEIDTANIVAESNENNNQKTRQFQVNKLWDLP